MKLAIQIMCWVTTIIFSFTILGAIFDPSIVDGDFSAIALGILIIAQSVTTLVYLNQFIEIE